MRIRGKKAAEEVLASSRIAHHRARWFTELRDKRQLSSEPQEVLWIEWKDNEDWPEYIARALRDSTHGLVRVRYKLGMPQL